MTGPSDENSSDREWIDRHLFDLLDGSLSSEDRQFMNEKLLHNPALQSHLVSLLLDESLLSTEVKSLRTLEDTWAAGNPILGTSAEIEAPGNEPADCSLPNLCRAMLQNNASLWRMGFVALACMLIVVLGLYLRRDDSAGSSFAEIGNAPDRLATQDSIATLLDVTECLWANGGIVSSQARRHVAQGDSLQLLEGIAQVDVNMVGQGSVRLLLEGNTSLVLANDHLPNLSQGRVLVFAQGLKGEFPVETPVGRIICSPDSEVGIVCLMFATEVHVFAGEARFESLWSNNDASDTDRENTVVKQDKAIRLSTNNVGVVTFQEALADSTAFAARIPMSATSLSIGPSYVAAVKASKPFGYWRFDTERNGVLPNEMGDHHHLYARNIVRRLGPLGNYYGAFNQNPKQASAVSMDEKQRPISAKNEPGVWSSLVTHDTFNGIFENGYAFELWCKPSHHHLGTMLNLVEPEDKTARKLGSAFHLELEGPVFRELRTGGTPCSVCFLHRHPVTSVTKRGTFCYSRVPYQSRKWCHIVATKDKETMRLYMNGELVGTSTDRSRLADGLRLSVGILFPYPRTVHYPYLGEMDELALYDHPLSEKEIQTHFQLGHEGDAPEPRTLTMHAEEDPGTI